MIAVEKEMDDKDGKIKGNGKWYKTERDQTRCL